MKYQIVFLTVRAITLSVSVRNTFPANNHEQHVHAECASPFRNN
jgi:hypothetical protein